ncbi:cbp/p300-interacting transactivator 4-like [Pan troglodytes]|uniref:cbp/p300-interacting transactivator 4-like n=1 Tax=Pan troglodytes TaxID=9598 RepID=UPI0030137B28
MDVSCTEVAACGVRPGLSGEGTAAPTRAVGHLRGPRDPQRFPAPPPPSPPSAACWAPRPPPPVRTPAVPTCAGEGRGLQRADSRPRPLELAPDCAASPLRSCHSVRFENFSGKVNARRVLPVCLGVHPALAVLSA